MSIFAQSGLVHQRQAKNQYGRAAILLVCAASAIVLLIALVLTSAPRAMAPGELAQIAVPP
jgi:hypothetical protein